MLFNTSPQGAGIHFESFLSLPPAGTFLNNIVVFNTGYGVWTDITVWPANFEYNDVHGNSAGSYGSLFGGLLVPANNISATPQFIADSDDGDWTNDDLAQAAGSACVDAGTSTAGYGVDDDYAGDPRPVDGDADGSALYDMGAFELQ